MIAAWASFIGYQAVWFVAVIFAGRGQWWPGVLAALAFLAWQLAVAPKRLGVTGVLLVALACGLVIDGIVSLLRFADYAAPSPSLPPGGAPLWILGLWACFAMTLSGPLKVLGERPWLAVVLGALGGPLAYAGASRGWDALTFHPPQWHGLAVLATGWAFAMPLLARLTHRWALVRSTP
ncbi:MAG: DUF2878 domain-containing protein [Luteibacter sp.]